MRREVMTTTELQTIQPDEVGSTFNYADYRDYVEERLVNKKSTGDNHSEKMLHYSRMNLFRMKRLDRFFELNGILEERLEQVRRKMIWVVLTEGWCGDAAQALPLISKMAGISDYIELELVLRDQNPELMEQFLTDDKSRSIPKLVCLDAGNREVLGTWGPRPNTAQKMVLNLREDSSVTPQEASETLHKWYADNQNKELQEEFLELIGEWDG